MRYQIGIFFWEQDGASTDLSKGRYRDIATITFKAENELTALQVAKTITDSLVTGQNLDRVGKVQAIEWTRSNNPCSRPMQKNDLIMIQPRDEGRRAKVKMYIFDGTNFSVLSQRSVPQGQPTAGRYSPEEEASFRQAL